MSVQQEIKRLTAPDIRTRKGGEPIVCLTSYHAHTARLVDRYCDVRTRSAWSCMASRPRSR
jgi:3-methyl-2-oxobutanoate hydroxymethyltransferase